MAKTPTPTPTRDFPKAFRAEFRHVDTRDARDVRRALIEAAHEDTGVRPTKVQLVWQYDVCYGIAFFDPAMAPKVWNPEAK